jgi:hypothetical protein
MSLLKRRLLYQKVKSKGQIMTKKREVSPNLAQNHPRRGIFRQHSVLSDKLLEGAKAQFGRSLFFSSLRADNVSSRCGEYPDWGALCWRPLLSGARS